MEEERREHVMKMKKMEAEMEQVFEMKVKEKKQKLRDSEAEVGFKIKKFSSLPPGVTKSLLNSHSALAYVSHKMLIQCSQLVSCELLIYFIY